MQKSILLTLFTFLVFNLIGQTPNVGIGTATPDTSAVLEVAGIKKGMLIPRMNSSNREMIGNPATGLLVYDTSHNLFYYYDGSDWVNLYSDDQYWSDNSALLHPQDIDVDIFRVGTVAIENIANENSSTSGLKSTIGGSGGADKIGINSVITNGGNGAHYGLKNHIAAGGGILYGIQTSITSSGPGAHYGMNNLLTNGSGDQFGVENTISAGFTGAHYGVKNVLSGASTGEQFGIHNMMSGTNSINKTGLYNEISAVGSGYSRGTENKIIGNASGTIIGSEQNINTTGNGDHWGSFNSLSGVGSGEHIASYNFMSGSGSGNQVGSKQAISIGGAGIHTGISNSISGMGNGDHIGVDNILSGIGNGLQYAVKNEITNSGSGIKYGVQNVFNNTGGNNSKFGINNVLTQLSGGSHSIYGSANDMQANGAVKIYGNHNVIINDGIGNSYGVYCSVTNNSSGTNIGGFFTAIGMNGNNYAGIFDQGQVGIGEVDPTAKIHIKDDQSSGRIAFIENESTNNNADILSLKLGRNTSPTTNNAYLSFRITGGVVGSITGDGAGGVMYNTTSDRRLKRNIIPYTNRLSLISQIPVRVYERIGIPNKKEIGFIAQEMYNVYPRIVSGTPANDINDPMCIDYSKITPVLVSAIQEQQKQIETLLARIELLEKNQ